MMRSLGLGLNQLGGGAMPAEDLERQLPRDGPEFAPAGGGNAGKYLLQVTFRISSLAALLNSIAMLSLFFVAAEVMRTSAWPNGARPPALEHPFQYGTLLLNLAFFAASLVVSIISAAALYGDPFTQIGGGALIRCAERWPVELLCAAVALLVLTYAVLGCRLITVANAAAALLPAVVPHRYLPGNSAHV